MATISITEGFAASFTNDDDHDMLEVNFSGIPDGVTVMITHIANNTEDGTDNPALPIPRKSR